MMTKERLLIEQGVQQGIKQGVQQGIKYEIKALKKFGIKEEDIIKTIKEDYNLTDEEVKEYLKER